MQRANSGANGAAQEPTRASWVKWGGKMFYNECEHFSVGFISHAHETN